MPNGKRGKKSLSLTDIPVEKTTKTLIGGLSDCDFHTLLNTVSQPTYKRGSSGCLTLHSERGSDLAEPNNLIRVVEKNLRDEDAARVEEQQRQARKLNRNPIQALAISRSPSPPERTSAGTTCANNKSIDFDAIKMDFIDDGGDGDVEMTDLGRTRTAKTFTRGNRECIPMEYSDQDQSNIPVPELGSLSHENDALLEHWKIPFLGGTPPSDNSLHIASEDLKKRAIEEHLLLDGVKSYERNTIEAPLVNTKIEEKKRKRNKKKDNKNTFAAETIPDYMGRLPLDQLVLLIEGKTTDSTKAKKSLADDDAVRKEKRRKSKEKKEDPSPATIGNQQGSQAADSFEEPQPVQGTPLSSKAKSKVSVVTKVQKKKEVEPRETCRSSVDDQEEEFISADEGVVSSNSDELVVSQAVAASDVMLDGANYRADTDDLSNIDNQVTEEQEFITVGARAKKKNITHHQTVRTGSTGKVPTPKAEPQQRRNSVEERPKGGRRPPTTSLAEYVEVRRTETRAHAKAVPFKNKNKHERLESEDEYPEVTGDETMVRVAESENGSTSSSEKTFSYADAAKKSSDPSRENSPACVALSTSSATPSPPPSTAEASGESTVISSPECGSTAASVDVPVSLPSPKNEDPSGISFFYDENEVKPETASDSAEASEGTDDAFVLNLGGKTVRFAKGMAAPVSEQPLDQRQRQMLGQLRKNWEDFHLGNPPVVYKPGM